MKRTIAAALATAALLGSSLARADYLYCQGQQCRVVQWTADRLIIELGLTCKPTGPWRSNTLPNGSTVLTRGKVCGHAAR